MRIACTLAFFSVGLVLLGVFLYFFDDVPNYSAVLARRRFQEVVDAACSKSSPKRGAATLPGKGADGSGSPASTSIESADCARQRRWTSQALKAHAKSTPPLSLFKGFKGCVEVSDVCFRNGELVYRGGRPSAITSLKPPQPTLDLQWFGFNDLLNMPGYHDGGGQYVQHGAPSLGYRIVSPTMDEDLMRAEMSDVVPVILKGKGWPFTIGEVYFRILAPWLSFAFNQRSVRHLPVVVPVPHRFELPDFYRILEPWVPSVESFETLGQRCNSGPLCFKRVIGCHPGTDYRLNSHWHLGAASWAKVVNGIVEHYCGAALARPLQRTGLTVAFAMRGGRSAQYNGYRQLLNVDELLSACANVTILGSRVTCRTIDFKSLTEDVCVMQEIDVMVSPTGSQIINSFFMRPGSSVIEIRPPRWYNQPLDSRGNYVLPDPPSWVLAFHHIAWLANYTFYWWYGLNDARLYSQPPGTRISRDMNVRLRWPVLACMLKKILRVGGNQQAYEKFNAYSNFGECEGFSPR